MSDIQFSEVLKNVFFIWNEYLEGIVYAPLLGMFFTADGKEAQDIINDFMKSPNKTEHDFYKHLVESEMLKEQNMPMMPVIEEYLPLETMISLSNSCNLRCIYCYVGDVCKINTLPMRALKQTIIQILANGVKLGAQSVEICFHGSGETTVKWRTFERAVLFAQSIKPDNMEIEFSMVTNGTLIDRNRAEFLSKHNFYVTLSMDGTEEIQNKHRPDAFGRGSFQKVLDCLRHLVATNVRFEIRTTVTGYNLHDMVNFVKLCGNEGAKKIVFMFFSPTGRGTSGVLDLDADLFCQEFEKAQVVAEELGIEIVMPVADIYTARAYFCGAVGTNCAITPTGEISSCSRVVDINDPLSKTFFIGHVTEDGFETDTEKIKKLSSYKLSNYKECEGCFAKYSCAGGCIADRIEENGIPEYWCNIVHKHLWTQIRRTIAQYK